jgi:hypothetical protein
MANPPVDPAALKKLKEEHAKTAESVKRLGTCVGDINSSVASWTEDLWLFRWIGQLWLTRWIREHRRTSMIAFLALVVTVVTLLYMVGQDVAHHISADFHDAIRNEIADQFKQHDTSKDLQQLQNDVAEIKGKLSILAPFIQELTRKRLEETKKLSAETLKSRLPELKNLVSLAQQEQVKVNPAVMRDVSKELLAVQP